jgi:hypothetical protein
MVAVRDEMLDEMLDEMGVNQVRLQARRAALERTLSDGWRAIDAAIAAGHEVAFAERRWLRLLSDYVQVCDQLQACDSPLTPAIADVATTNGQGVVAK